MNISNFAHAGLAVLCQLFVALIAVSFFGFDVVSAATIGGALSAGFYWGREVDQNERKRGTPPWWSGFNFKYWSLDSKLDLLFPVVAVIAVIVLATMI